MDYKLINHSSLEDAWPAQNVERPHKVSLRARIVSVAVAAVLALGICFLVSQCVQHGVQPMQPMTTDLSVGYRGTTELIRYEKRFAWGLAIGLIGLAALPISIYGTYQANSNLATEGGAGNGLLCVWGAISTILTVVGAGNAF